MINKEKNYSVLVIDDSPINRVYIKTIVEENLKNFIVFEAHDGLEGYRMAREKKPDVILLDIMMPEVDGYKVCEMLKADETTFEIPVIFLSALSEIDDKAKGFQVGGVDYITKPAHPKEVMARVLAHAELYNAKKELKDYIEKVNRDLKMAQKVQFEMLPRIKEANNLSFEWYFLPSFNVSGDMVGMIPFDNRESIAYIVDVSGHGAASAMLSMALKEKLESIIVEQNIHDPAMIGKRIDERLTDIFVDGNYFTMIIARITDNKVELCNFGHREPMVANNNQVKVLTETNLPLGIGLVRELDVTVMEIEFNKDDVLILYTDGIIEAGNDKNIEFGLDKLVQTVKDTQIKNPKNIITNISSELTAFMENEQPEDDVTIFAIKKNL